jgi:hypothetical protein
MEFDPSEDKEEIQAVLHAAELQRVIDEFKEWLINQSKYNEKDSLAIADIQVKINDLISENGCVFIFE